MLNSRDCVVESESLLVLFINKDFNHQTLLENYSYVINSIAYFRVTN